MRPTYEPHGGLDRPARTPPLTHTHIDLPMPLPLASHLGRTLARFTYVMLTTVRAATRSSGPVGKAGGGRRLVRRTKNSG